MGLSKWNLVKMILKDKCKWTKVWLFQRTQNKFVVKYKVNMKWRFNKRIWRLIELRFTIWIVNWTFNPKWIMNLNHYILQITSYPPSQNICYRKQLSHPKMLVLVIATSWEKWSFHQWLNWIWSMSNRWSRNIFP